MTEEILGLKERRRRLKGNLNRYKETDREVKGRCKEKKEERLREECDEIEALEKVKSKQMYDKIKVIRGKRDQPEVQI